MTNFNQTPFLPNQLDFPTDDARQLAIVLDKAYIDIANRINDRTIGVYATVTPFIVGDAYYLSGGVQGRKISQRKVFVITSTAAPIPLGFTYSQLVNLYGDWTDGSGAWYGFIAGTPNALPGQIVISTTATDLVFTVDAGAPALTSGLVVVEWI